MAGRDLIPDDLDVSAALTRVEAAVRAGLRSAPTPALADLATAVDRMRAGQTISWRPFADLVRAARPDVRPWDLVQIGSEFIRHDREHTTCTIDDDGRSGWHGGRGVIAPWPRRDATAALVDR